MILNTLMLFIVMLSTIGGFFLGEKLGYQEMGGLVSFWLSFGVLAHLETELRKLRKAQNAP